MKQKSNQRIYNHATLFMMALVWLFSSCKSSSELSSQQIIQKRKYTKGYHLNARIAHPQKAKRYPSIAMTEKGTNYDVSENVLADVQVPIESSITASAEPSVAMAEAPPIAYTTKGSSTVATKAAPAYKGAYRIIAAHPLLGLLHAPKVVDPDYAGGTYTYGRRTPGLAIAGFISSLVGIFVAGVPLGLLGIIFGAIALGKINNNPVEFGGSAFAILAILIGAVAVVGALIVISNMA